MFLASDLVALFLFSIILTILPIIGFPIVYYFFPHASDRGFAFARLISLVALTYLGWLMGSFDLPIFTTIGLQLFLVLFAGGSLVLWYINRKKLLSFIEKSWKLIAFEELIFWLCFLVFVFIRWKNPDLWHPALGGEKPMDFAFLNASLKNPTMPPLDPWFAGETIHYYYFGQTIAATLIHISTVTASVGYNLVLAYLFGQTASIATSFVYGITKSRIAAVLGSIFLVVSGNFAQIGLVLKKLKQISFPEAAWYWNASRIMPNNEINEFPFFTFIYADLHAHLVAIPLVIMTLALTFQLTQEKKVIRLISLATLVGILLGIIRMTNTWDYPTYLALTIGWYILSRFTMKNLKQSILFSILVTIIVGIISLVSVMPFLNHYQTPPVSVLPFVGPFTTIADYFMIHGLFIFILLSVLGVIFVKQFKKGKRAILNSFALISITVGSGILYYKHLPFQALILFLVAISTYFLFTLIRKQTKELLSFISLLLFIAAIGLTLVPDTVYLPIGLGRMNMVFKYYFQAWILFSFASALGIFYIYQSLEKQKIVRYMFVIVFMIVFSPTLIYAPTATWAKMRDRMSPKTPHTLNGTAYMKDSTYHDEGRPISLKFDLEATSWMNNHIIGTPTIVEATGPTYRWGSRVSIYTGFPTIIGWDWHETAHRFSDIEVHKRVEDVKQLYETTDTEKFLSIIAKYDVQYVYLGELERLYYPGDGLSKFKDLEQTALEKVYENPEVTVYKVR